LLVAVTDHAAERYLQRVRGTLDPKPEIAGRVSGAWENRVEGERGDVFVRDGSLVFVCVHDRPRSELVVVTCWEEGDEASVPRRYTDALRKLDLRRPGRSA
jgi:hypothetical protein